MASGESVDAEPTRHKGMLVSEHPVLTHAWSGAACMRLSQQPTLVRCASLHIQINHAFILACVQELASKDILKEERRHEDGHDDCATMACI